MVGQTGVSAYSKAFCRRGVFCLVMSRTQGRDAALELRDHLLALLVRALQGQVGPLSTLAQPDALDARSRRRAGAALGVGGTLACPRHGSLRAPRRRRRGRFCVASRPAHHGGRRGQPSTSPAFLPCDSTLRRFSPTVSAMSRVLAASLLPLHRLQFTRHAVASLSSLSTSSDACRWPRLHGQSLMPPWNPLAGVIRAHGVASGTRACPRPARAASPSTARPSWPGRPYVPSRSRTRAMFADAGPQWPPPDGDQTEHERHAAAGLAPEICDARTREGSTR